MQHPDILTLAFVCALEAKEGNLCARAKDVAQNPEADAKSVQLLLDILTPLTRMGAFIEDNGTHRIDIKTLRQFFMGVMGWTPATVMREASLEDLADALEGYLQKHRPLPRVPGAAFLHEMMKNFPDGDAT